LPVTWQLLESDREAFARDLDTFVQPRVFDIHAHLWEANWWADPPSHVAAAPATIGRREYQDHIQWILPGREVEALHFAYPFPTDAPGALRQANEFVGAQIAGHSPGQFLVSPSDDPDWVRQEVRRLGMRGLKPFCFYANVPNIWEAELPDYLPEPIMRVAHEEGWTITIHLVRARGIADPSNLHWVRHYCQTYPNAQLILDHCARGFNPYHTLEGLSELSGLVNLWVDTSAVCSPAAVQAALEAIGPHRLLYGSDFYVSHMRATNFPLGDTFLWLDEDSPVTLPAYAPGAGWPLTGLENLRAIKAAFHFARLTDSQVEAFFHTNALGLLAL
jgi:predicted TIM-barrel fold metal-dependent hydrolase